MRQTSPEISFGAAVLAAASLGLAACGSPDTFNRKQMLKDTTNQVILESHQSLTEEAKGLDEAAQTFCEGDRKSGQLDEARQAWKDLQGPLKWVQAWSFNNSPYRGSSFEVLYYKVDREPSWGDNIEAVVQGGDARYREDRRQDGDEEPDRVFPDGNDSIDVEFVKEQSYLRNAQGWPAVEYLLFGQKEGTGMGELYKSGDNADRRCEYLLALTEHARGKTEDYANAWSRDGGNFASTFDSATDGNMEWRTVQDSIDAMVSQMIFITKNRLSKNLLGGPLGDHSDTAKIPDSVSSPHANHSVKQMKATLAGLEKIYNGPSGKSLADYAKFRKSSVHEAVKKRISGARKAIDAIPTPLEDALENDRQKVKDAQNAVNKLNAVIEADLKTTLGASTTRVIVDND